MVEISHADYCALQYSRQGAGGKLCRSFLEFCGPESAQKRALGPGKNGGKRGQKPKQSNAAAGKDEKEKGNKKKERWVQWAQETTFFFFFTRAAAPLLRPLPHHASSLLLSRSSHSPFFSCSFLFILLEPGA